MTSKSRFRAALILLAAIGQLVQAQIADAQFCEEDPTSFGLSVGIRGGGKLVSAPAGIDCGEGNNDCEHIFYQTVTLTAIPREGWVFRDWSGGHVAGVCPETETCVIPVACYWWPSLVEANFSQRNTLLVTLDGLGSGVVTSSPAGIDCGSDCSEDYLTDSPVPGVLVTLTATPEPGSVFSGWSGLGLDCPNATPTCTVRVVGATQVTATFSREGLDFYTVQPCRVLSTRDAGTPLISGIPLLIYVTGACNVPLSAKAVSLNLTVISPASQGSITLYPGDIPAPGTSTINFRALLNRANNVVMPLASNGDGTLAALAVISGGGTMDIAVDVNGYFE